MIKVTTGNIDDFKEAREKRLGKRTKIGLIFSAFLIVAGFILIAIDGLWPVGMAVVLAGDYFGYRTCDEYVKGV